MDSSSSTALSVYVLLIIQSNATWFLHYYNLDESSLVALEELMTDQQSQNLLTW